MDEFRIMFHGFHPSEFTRSYVNERMSHLQDEAPYGAMLKPTVSRNDGEYKCQISINSTAGHFFTSASAHKLKDAVSKAMTQMKRQLNKWKTQRFTHDRITEHLPTNENETRKENTELAASS